MRLLPKKANTEFDTNKQKAIKWFLLITFIAITMLTVARSLIHTFADDGGANMIAGIKKFNSPADGTLYMIFSLWGWAQLGFGILYVLVLIRYRNWIPLMFVFLLIEYVGRLVLGFAKGIPSGAIEGTAPGDTLNYVMVVLIGLSLIWIIATNVIDHKNKELVK